MHAWLRLTCASIAGATCISQACKQLSRFPCTGWWNTNVLKAVAKLSLSDFQDLHSGWPDHDDRWHKAWAEPTRDSFSKVLNTFGWPSPRPPAPTSGKNNPCCKPFSPLAFPLSWKILRGWWKKWAHCIWQGIACGGEWKETSFFPYFSPCHSPPSHSGSFPPLFKRVIFLTTIWHFKTKCNGWGGPQNASHARAKLLLITIPTQVNLIKINWLTWWVSKDSMGADNETQPSNPVQMSEHQELS